MREGGGMIGRGRREAREEKEAILANHFIYFVVKRTVGGAVDPGYCYWVFRCCLLLVARIVRVFKRQATSINRSQNTEGFNFNVFQ